MTKKILFLALIFVLTSCNQNYEKKTVICIPVYGQSLALGEEAERITDFDSLAEYSDGRIVTENLDYNYGYFDNNGLKQYAKKILGYQKRAFELSVYSMAMKIADNTESDTIICIFPGGQGATAIANLSKGTKPYTRFIHDIETAYNKAVSRGWSFSVPAICWMQGESDIVDYPNTNYQQLLKKIWKDMNTDILQITHQRDSIPFICYQANSISRARNFHEDRYNCKETIVPQAFVNIIKNDKWFWASGPTYPYSCIGEKIHIDALGQRKIGSLAAISALSYIRREKKRMGLQPDSITTKGDSVIISFYRSSSHLTIDTIQVSKANQYGFSVINKENDNIIKTVKLENDTIIITCKESPKGCKIRYAINGDYMKSGHLHGPRGNLRDQENNWCYQFDILCN